jgi:hypothetical protein
MARGLIMIVMTQHANQRSAQRSVSLEVIDLILSVGCESKQPGNAIRHVLTNKDTNSIIKNLKDAIKLVEKARKKAILTTETGSTVITVMNSKH